MYYPCNVIQQAFKNLQSHTRRNPHDFPYFACHHFSPVRIRICGTFMYIPGIERYKSMHKRFPLFKMHYFIIDIIAQT